MRGTETQLVPTTSPVARAASQRRARPDRPVSSSSSSSAPAIADPDAVARAWRSAARRIRWCKGKPLIRWPLLTARTLLHPVIAARDAVVRTVAVGGAARELAGVSLTRQFIQQWTLAMRYGMHPRDYYNLRLYLPDRYAKAGRFIHERAALAVVRTVNDVPDAKVLGDKQRFADACQKFGLPHVPVIAHFEDGAIVRGEVPAGHDLFIKCTRLNCGHGIELWRWDDSDQTLSHGGHRMAAAELTRHVAELSRSVPVGGDGTQWHGSDGKRVVESRPYIVQPRARNHPVLDAFSDGPLCTARMVTVRPKGDGPRFACGALRMPGAGGSSVDNFNSGGLAAPIDAEGGVLGPAIMKDPRKGLQRYHPNGAAIAGTALPYWEAAVALVEWAHACFPGISSVGWDVGLTPGGPVLLEANYGWDCDILQMTHGKPLAEMPLARWMVTYLT